MSCGRVHTSKVTSDCLVDRLEQWWAAVRDRYAPVTTLVLNLDNGPELDFGHLYVGGVRVTGQSSRIKRMSR